MRHFVLIVPLFLFTPSTAPAQVPPAAPPAQAAEVAENLVSFDLGTINLRWEQGHWSLIAGERILKDFGRRESEARQALGVIQELHLNQFGTVGRPSPIVEYWLSSGRAPAGFTPGLRRLSVDASTLRVERMQSQWCLRDARTILFNFGIHAEEAARALAIVRKYGFTDLAVIGPAQPAMFVFLAPVNGGGPSARIAPASGVRQTSYQPEGTERDNGLINASPGALLDPRTAPAVPPLAGAANPFSPQVSFVLQNTPDGPHSPADLGNSAPSSPGRDEKMECVPFNCLQVQICQDNGVWKLSADNYVLCTFGDDEEAARQALSVLHHYHFTEHYRIGRPQPRFSFFLINGQAPVGMMFGLSGLAFQPGKLSVEKLGLSWSLCEGNRVLVMLGEKPDEARQLLELIQQHKFDRLCHIGPSKQGMSFLVRSR